MYRVATGSKKVRNVFTPFGAILFALFTALFVIIALQVDKLFKLPEFIPSPFNYLLALPIILFGLLAMGWSVFHFLKVKGTPVPFNPPPNLVATGPYAYARNPMLTGIFILLVGLGVLFQSLSLVLFFAPAFIAVNVWELKAIEEPELEKRLGAEYIEYKRKTPMFIPRLERKPGKRK